MNNKFVVVVPFYNAEKWIDKSLRSVVLQEYKNFECLIMDDASSDNSVSYVKRVIEGDSRFTLVTNEKNLGPLGNVQKAITSNIINIEDEDIIVILDGDDFFYSKRTLNILNDCYNENSCWMTYGSYVSLSDKKRGKFAKQLPAYVVENNLFRQHEWCTSHLRSYKKFLVDNVKPEDLKDEDGNFFKAAGDLALMFPLLELSGDKSQYIGDILYIWNDLNSLNEHKVKRESQLVCERMIRSGNKYSKLVRSET
tara:strand:- start:75 stop:833 length:759 start_codon:yes stop_codon:yes gene_type:complete